MSNIPPPQREISDELNLLNELIPLQAQRIIELGCGAAKLGRSVVARFPACDWVGLEVDQTQHTANLAASAPRMQFVAAGASNFKKLPPGWKFRVKTLDKNYIEVPVGGVATIMPDEFFNVYDKTGPGMSNYKP